MTPEAATCRPPAHDAADLAVIFPPHWYYPHAPHELASLTASMRARGLRTRAYDLNLGSTLYFLSVPYLRRTRERLLLEWADLGARPNLAAPQRRRVLALADALASGEHTLSGIADALDCIRSDAFYDIARHRRAVRTMNRAWDLISLAHAPTEIGLQRFRPAHDQTSLDECIAAATDAGTNPYVDYVASAALPEIVSCRPTCIAMVYVHPDQMIPLVTLLVALRSAGFDGHVTVLGNLEDQVTFARYLRHERHPDYPRLFELVDSVIYHDSEAALDQVTRLARSRRDIDERPANVATYRDEHLAAPTRFDVTDLDSLPTPDYRDLELNRYLFPEPVISLLTSRGCYWGKCTFCAITTNHLSFRGRATARVVDDLQELRRRHGARWFHFRDMLFSPAHARSLSTEILRRGERFRWLCRARFEPAFTRELLDLMARAGCVQIWFGLESASQRVLDLMDKGTRLDTVERVIADCARAGIGVHALVIHGFPTETSTEAQATARFLEQHSAAIDAVTYTDFVLFDGTPVFERSADFGVTVHDGQGEIFRHSFEHRSDRPSEERGRAYVASKSRLDETLEMPLAHVAHVSLFRERHGAGSWRARTPRAEPRADTDTSAGTSVLERDDRLSWRHPAAWLGASWDVAGIARGEVEARSRACLLVSQAGRDGFVQVDALLAGALESLDSDRVAVLIGVVASRFGMDEREVEPAVLRGLTALVSAGFVDVTRTERQDTGKGLTCWS